MSEYPPCSICGKILVFNRPLNRWLHQDKNAFKSDHEAKP